MASYIIFIPDTKSELETRDAMQKVGLGDLLEGAQCQHITGGGPNGGHGHLVHWSCPTHHERNCKLVVDEDIIDWAESKPAGLFWMGQEHDRPVAPEDIAIAEPVPHDGTIVELGDQQSWEVPLAQQLPHKPSLDENGDVTMTVHPQYQEFFDRAMELFSSLAELAGDIIDQEVKAVEAVITLKDGWNFATQSLAMNYRLNRQIVDWLGLFSSTDDIWAVCAATVGEVSDFVTAQKKTAMSVA